MRWLHRPGLKRGRDPQVGSSAARPLFAIGAARSGTTLLARILNAHPAVLLTNQGLS